MLVFLEALAVLAGAFFAGAFEATVLVAVVLAGARLVAGFFGSAA